MTTTPIFDFRYMPEAGISNEDAYNETILMIEALMQRKIIDRDLTAPPSSPSASNGDVYLVPAAGGSPSVSGAWLGQEDNLAIYYNGWIFITPTEGPVYLVADENIYIEWDASLSPSAWVVAMPDTFTLTIDVGDETTTITTGTAKKTLRMPAAVTLSGVRASLTTASSSGGPVAVDINEGGVSILSTTLTIDDTETTSTTAATPAVISDSALADDAEITIDIDTAGTGAAGLKVTLIGTYN